MNESCHIWVMSHMNESCHIWMSHVTYEGVMSHMKESCHLWMSHVTYEWVMSHMKESCHIWMSHVMSDGCCHKVIWLSRLCGFHKASRVISLCDRTNQKFVHKWVMSHMNGSCHILTKAQQSYHFFHIGKVYQTLCDTQAQEMWLVHMWHDSCMIFMKKWYDVYHIGKVIWKSDMISYHFFQCDTHHFFQSNTLWYTVCDTH